MQGERGEADQINEADGQPVQRSVGGFRLGRTLPIDGVAHVMGEDGSHRVSELDGGGVAVARSLAQATTSVSGRSIRGWTVCTYSETAASATRASELPSTRNSSSPLGPTGFSWKRWAVSAASRSENMGWCSSGTCTPSVRHTRSTVGTSTPAREARSVADRVAPSAITRSPASRER